jgi:hypothetical protein
MKEFLPRTPRGGLQFDALVSYHEVQCTKTQKQNKRKEKNDWRVKAHWCNEGFADKVRLQVRWGSV